MGTYVAKLQIGNDTSNQAAFADILYGTCTTNAAVTEKNITMEYIDRVFQGLQVRVKFTAGNSATENVTLNFLNTSMSPVLVSGDCVCEANDIITFTYDESNPSNKVWRVTSGGISSVIKNYITNTTTETIAGITGDMIFKGTLGNPPATDQTLPAAGYKAGWTYKVVDRGEYVGGSQCEPGDVIIAIHEGPTTGTTVTNADWTIVQANIDGAVTGPSGTNPVTDGQIAVFNGTTGRMIRGSSYTLGTSVPSDAVFTDHEYHLDTTNVSPYTSSEAMTSDSDGNGTVLVTVEAGVLKLANGIKFTTSTAVGTVVLDAGATHSS